MSVIEAEVEVDETEIPTVRIGQVAKITIDALPGRTFTGKVTEIGNSPLQTEAQAQAGQQATNFKVTVQIDGQIEEARPGFTCSAEITTATRQHVLTVPIQAMAVRELVYDREGKVVRAPLEKNRRSRSPEPAVSAAELPAGQTRKESEGVFLLRDGAAVFVPVKTGIAGDKYFEVLDGLKAGEQVVTGPFNSVRNLKDGDEARVEQPKKDRKT
jgi:HlyD family secretion protein